MRLRQIWKTSKGHNGSVIVQKWRRRWLDETVVLVGLARFTLAFPFRIVPVRRIFLAPLESVTLFLSIVFPSLPQSRQQKQSRRHQCLPVFHQCPLVFASQIFLSYLKCDTWGVYLVLFLWVAFYPNHQATHFRIVNPPPHPYFPTFLPKILIVVIVC